MIYSWIIQQQINFNQYYIDSLLAILLGSLLVSVKKNSTGFELKKFPTNVFIWSSRGNFSSYRAFYREQKRSISFGASSGKYWPKW